VAFDLTWLNGADLRPLPLTERRRRLQDILPTGSAIISEALSVTGTGPIQRPGRAAFPSRRSRPAPCREACRHGTGEGTHAEVDGLPGPTPVLRHIQAAAGGARPEPGPPPKGGTTVYGLTPSLRSRKASYALPVQ